MAGHGKSKQGPCLEIAGSPKFRSAWERNVYRVLRALYLNQGKPTALRRIVRYEPVRFKFDQPYRRKLDYLPDFVIYNEIQYRELSGEIHMQLEIDHIVEVKGWLDGPSKTKLLGFKKYYPELTKNMIVVTQSSSNILWVVKNLGCKVWDYGDLKKQVAGVIVWE